MVFQKIQYKKIKILFFCGVVLFTYVGLHMLENYEWFLFMHTFTSNENICAVTENFSRFVEELN